MKKILLALLIALMPVCAIAQTQPQITATLTSSNTTATLQNLLGASNCSVQITGAWTGTINFTVSNDDVNFYASPNDSITSATVGGMYFVTCASTKYIRVTGVGLTGTAVVSIVASNGTAPKAFGSGAVSIQCTSFTNCPTNNAAWGGIALGGATAAGTAASGNIITVQGNASGIALPVTASGGVFTSNISQWNGVSLGSPTAAGTSASGNIIPVQGVTGGVPVGIQSVYNTGGLSGGGCNGFTNAGAAIVPSAAGTTPPVGSYQQIVPLTAGASIHICSIIASANTVTAAGAFTLDYGTGTNCATGPTNIMTVLAFGVSTPAQSMQLGDGQDGIYTIPAGEALCANAIVGSAFGSTSFVYVTYAKY